MEKINSKSSTTHYHALILLKEIKKQDKNSFLKVKFYFSYINNFKGFNKFSLRWNI